MASGELSMPGFASYLLGRSQVTEVGFNLSTECMISCGVPQGSVLGPLLFLIYINDIHHSSAKLSFYLFADDTSLLYADTNLKSLEKTVNSELLKVSDLLNANKLTLNAKKSNYVIFRFGAKLWNAIPNEFRQLSKRAFEKNFRDFLLSIMEAEDDYVEAPILLQKMAMRR